MFPRARARDHSPAAPGWLGAAGLPGLLFHHLRRSAVRNFEALGPQDAEHLPPLPNRGRKNLREALTRTEPAVGSDQGRTVIALPAVREGRS